MKKFWNIISENGIPLEMDLDEKKRIRFLNRMLMVVVILSFSFLCVDLFYQVYEGVAITLLTITTCTIILFMISKKKFKISKWFSIIFILAYISTLTLMTGKNTGTIIYLIPGVLFPTVIFKNKKTILLLSISIICLFSYLFWTIQKIDPIIQLTDELRVIYQFSGTLGVIIVSFLMIWYFKNLNDEYENIIISNNRKLSNSNEQINQQRLKLEIKNKEVTDSINYARTIQNAILPTEKKVNTYLQKNFILYLPKDIVAGDFYWIEANKDLIHFAVADCTGHGVPGAIVSVVCHNALNRSVKEFNLNKPSEILNKTRELVIDSFNHGESDVKDGMDIAFCTLDKKNKTLQFAGANNPLLIVRDKKIIELKGDRQPIAKYSNYKNFTNHTIELKSNDSIYLFTDGFQDQFGGPKGKKLKLKGFKEILLNNNNKSMRHQKNRIEDAFKIWKDDLEQIDDICIIGYKVE